jgi:hypothetical protein
MNIEIKILGRLRRRQNMLQYKCYRTDVGRPEKTSAKLEQVLVA